MKWNVEVTLEFLRMAKRLKKKYRSLFTDLNTFKEDLARNPLQGAVLTPGIRKIRMAISAKGAGKSKGARVITLTYCINADEGNVVLLLIYDHNVADTVDSNMVKRMIHNMGIDWAQLQDQGKLK